MNPEQMTPQQFKEWRKHLGISKSKAAEFLGVSLRTVDHYESGVRSDNGNPVVVPLARLSTGHNLKGNTMLNINQAARDRYPNLCNALAPKVETFLEFFARKGIKDPKPRSVKWYNAMAASSTSSEHRKFPDDVAFRHQVLVERQSPLFTFNAPDCIGDMPQFSSRGLTDWYVAEFCRLNKLKEC